MIFLLPGVKLQQAGGALTPAENYRGVLFCESKPRKLGAPGSGPGLVLLVPVVLLKVRVLGVVLFKESEIIQILYKGPHDVFMECSAA